MKKVLFRCCFIFFLLAISPWYLLSDIPGVSSLLDFYNKGEVRVVELFNQHLLHIKDTLNIESDGSGDTSYAWAQFYTFLLLSCAGSAVWTIVDRRRPGHYDTLAFWLRNLVRYYVALVSFSYGIIKLFALQMPFPNLSQLATPLGDFLPMRLSWMFIGYSTPYQVFSGTMEILVGILLLNRRTVTPGALLGAGVFANVFMLNLCYDVPVKQYSMLLLIYCIYLILSDRHRVLNFFWLNKPAAPTALYELELTKKWQRIARIVLKTGFVIVFVGLPLQQAWSRYRKKTGEGGLEPVKIGVYNINTFVKNNDTIPLSNDDTAWKDFIFDKRGLGSINTTDSLFRQRYHRGYFIYQPDTVTKSIAFKRSPADSTNLFEMNYRIVDENTIELRGKVKADSLFIQLQRTDRHFQLTERQFHWITEFNR